MANILDKAKTNNFNNPVVAVFNGVKKGLLIPVGFALVLMLQVTFFSSGAIASPLANIGNQIGNKVDKMTQGVKTDMAIDKVAGTVKEISRDLRDGRTDKVIDKVADTSKDIAKEAGNRAKDLAKGTKENMGKAKEVAKDAKDKIGEGVEKTKEVASDTTNEVKAGAKNLPDSGNQVDEAIDSVKNFLGQ